MRCLTLQSGTLRALAACARMVAVSLLQSVARLSIAIALDLYDCGGRVEGVFDHCDIVSKVVVIVVVVD